MPSPTPLAFCSVQTALPARAPAGSF